MKRNLIISRIIILFLFLQESAQIIPQANHIKFDKFTIRQGLSNNRVEAIYQDRKGFMWFGTQVGLNRFDGYEFINYGEGFYNGGCIFEDSRGYLWILKGSDGGLLRFDRIKEKFVRYPNVDSRAHHLYEDGNSNLWIPTKGLGLAKYISKSDTFRIYKHISGDNNSLPSDTVNVVYQDKQGAIWIGTPHGLCSFSIDNESFIPFKKRIRQNILSISEDNEGILWVGTDNGLYKINESRTSLDYFSNKSGTWNQMVYIFIDHNNKLWLCSTGTISRFDPVTNTFINYEGYLKSLLVKGITKAIEPIHEDSQSVIWTAINCNLSSFNENKNDFEIHNNDKGEIIVCSAFTDRSGILWVGTMNDGVYRLDNNSKQFMNVFNNIELEKLNINRSVTAVFKDQSDILWIGKPDGLFKLNLKNGLINLYKQNPEDPSSISGNTISQIIQYSPSSMLVGTVRQGLNKFDIATGRSVRYLHEEDNPKTLSNNNIVSLLIDKKNNLWVSTGFMLEKFNSADSSFSHYYDSTNNPWINTIYEDKNSRIWLGTNYGLGTFDTETNTFKYFLRDPKNELRPFINTIYEDSKGTLWLATDDGLDKFDRTNGNFTRISTTNGLASNQIICMLEDDNNNLWLLTARGISKFNPTSGKIRNYDELDGVDISAVIYNPAYKDEQGEMFFGSFDGLIRFHPHNIKDNDFIPPIAITHFQKFNKNAELDSSIIEKKLVLLSHDENNISFEFAALNYTSPQKNQYAYKMEGVDKDWVYSGTRRYASFPNLDPGEYIFRVKGSNNDGVWNKVGTSIAIIISPPWWKTWWAYSSYALLFIFALFGVRRYEMNRIKLKNQVKLDEVVLREKEETDRMKSSFFANISHEFRTPLTLILGPAEKISSKTSDDVIKDANIIKRNSKRLLQLINQLLDLSKLESGKLKLDASKGNIVSFVKGVALSFESLAESKDITLKLLPEKEFIELYFDKEKMMKILTNIISNAFKFTPEEGTITVSINEKLSGNVDIKIKDTGIGIPKDEIPKLFDRFYQVDSSFIREYEGTGIGLALTKELVVLHHGNISVESEMGKYSEFILQFPTGREHLKDDEIIEEVHLENQVILNSLPAQSLDVKDLSDERNSQVVMTDFSSKINVQKDKEKTIILVVEDNYDMRQYIRDSLNSSYLIEEAVNGEQGVRKAEKIIPDLIISDMMMPKMDGNQLVKILKNDEKTSHIPIILLTAKAGHEDKLEGLEIGADDYLTKPFDIKELQVRIKNLISVRKKLQEKFSKIEFKVVKAEHKKLSSLDEKFMFRVHEIIEKHIAEEEFNMEQLGEELFMSRMQVHRKLKALTGKSANRYIRSVKLNKAKHMIEEKTGNISEIAYSLGFGSPAYFTKCFKDEFGYAPSEVL